MGALQRAAPRLGPPPRGHHQGAAGGGDRRRRRLEEGPRDAPQDGRRGAPSRLRTGFWRYVPRVDAGVLPARELGVPGREQRERLRAEGEGSAGGGAGAGDGAGPAPLDRGGAAEDPAGRAHPEARQDAGVDGELGVCGAAQGRDEGRGHGGHVRSVRESSRQRRGPEGGTVRSRQGGREGAGGGPGAGRGRSALVREGRAADERPVPLHRRPGLSGRGEGQEEAQGELRDLFECRHARGVLLGGLCRRSAPVGDQGVGRGPSRALAA